MFNEMEVRIVFNIKSQLVIIYQNKNQELNYAKFNFFPMSLTIF